jgi:ankyrin repeat protein
MSAPASFRAIALSLLALACAGPSPEQLAVHAAAGRGDLAALDALLASDPALLEADTPLGGRPLMSACAFGQEDTVRHLLDRGADVTARRDLDDATALHATVCSGSRAIAQLLLDRGADVDARDFEDFTPLHHAATEDLVAVAEVLLEHGADGDAVGTRYDERPLHKAADSGSLGVARQLLAHGAEVDARKANGWTPLFDAAQDGDMEMARLLLDAGADVNAFSDGGHWPYGPVRTTALTRARSFGTEEMVALLLSHGADPDPQPD